MSLWWLSFILFALPVRTLGGRPAGMAESMDAIHLQLASANPSWGRVVTQILKSSHRIQHHRQSDECCATDRSDWWCRRRRQHHLPDEGDLHPANLLSNQVGHRSGPPMVPDEDADWAAACRATRTEVYLTNSSSADTMMRDVSSLPAIFSVLINFGRNQYYQFLLSLLDYAEEDHGCDSGFVWDPFALGCRRIYCGSEQLADPVLRDYCGSDAGGGGDNDWRMTYVMELDVVQLTLYVDTVVDDQSLSDEELLAVVQESFTPAFASFVGISDERVSRLNSSFFNGTEESNVDAIRSLAISFWLSQSAEGSEEPTIDQVVTLMGGLIVSDRLMVVLDGMAVKLAGLHEQPVQSEADAFANWCRGGVTTIYFNDEFLLDVDHNADTNQSEVLVYVKATNQWYNSDEYMANLFFYGSSESNANLISGSVAICENRSVLVDSDCTVLMLNASEVTFVNNTVHYNGSIPFIQPILYPGEYETLPDGSLAVCLDYETDWPTGLIIESCIGCALMVVSIVAMLATVVTYALFDELRNLAGLAVMNLCLTTAMFQLTIMLGMLITIHHKTTLCTATSIVVHYEGLASIFWTNVMAADLHLTLCRLSAAPRSPSKILPRYALYAYGLPLVIVSISAGINFCHCTGEFEIEYGRPYCWINNAKANMIFFGLPLALALTANLVLFVKTVTIVQRSSAGRQDNCTRRQKAICQLKLYARMSTVMGFAWVFAFIAACFDPTTATGMVFTFVYIILNSMGGIFIFVAFTCTRRVRQLYGNLWAQRQLKRSSTTSSTTSSNSSTNKMTTSIVAGRTKTISVETLVSNGPEELADQSTLHI